MKPLASTVETRLLALAATGGLALATTAPANALSASATGRVIGASTAIHLKAPSSAKLAARFAGASLASQTVVISSGAVAVKVSCPASTYRHCAVKLTLKTTRAVRVGGGRSEILTLGSGSATITPGRSAAIHLRLSKQALRLIRSSKGRLQPYALAQSRDAHGARASKSRKISVTEAGAPGGGEEPSSAY